MNTQPSAATPAAPMGRTQAALALIAAHPIKLAVFTLWGGLMVWLVLTKSLPFALAKSSPDTALWLNPNNTVALTKKAEEIRVNLLAMAKQPPKDKGAAGGATRFSPPAYTSRTYTKQEREAAQSQIRAIAKRIIALDPLNARAYRLLGEVTHDRDQIRKLMQAAFKRSKREAIAIFWLLADAFERKDHEAVLDYAEILFLTQPSLNIYLMSYLGQIVEHQDARDLLVRRLAQKPKWRTTFLTSLPRYVRNLRTPLRLMVALKKAGGGVTDAELLPYLNVLLGKKQVELAYNVWLQQLSKKQLAKVALLNNSGFESNPSGLPFDWAIKTGINAVAEFVALSQTSEHRALYVKFGSGRIEFPVVSQIITLAPGSYRLTGSVRGELKAKRGLRWQIRCLHAKTKSTSQTEMILGSMPEKQAFELTTIIPDEPGCRGQVLRLFHDARSASEQFVAGEVWFSDLELKRVTN